MTFIIRPDDKAGIDQLGGKAGALAALHQTGLPVPAWFVLSPLAFYASLSRPQREALVTAGDRAEMLALLENLEPAPAVQADLARALAELCPQGELVAVRSSALEEDGSEHSFAGQLESFLLVPPQLVAGKVASVWRSGFSQRVLAYRRERGLNSTPQPPAVLIQRMVRAQVSGVAFSADPVGARRDVAVVAAVYGLGTALVSGESDADTYHVALDGRLVWRNVADKRLAHQEAHPCPHSLTTPPNGSSDIFAGPRPEAATGVRRVTVPPAQAGHSALTEAQVQAVAGLARQAERFFGRPQDIEWAIEADRLYLLQARPITALPQAAGAVGVLNVWDNSNIAESYPGLTTPLTFSFARRAYEEVYRQFCRLMGVPAATIARNHNTFRRMLGYIRGRVYYNLLSWYRVLAMLPGYQLNRRFMEQMMGVKESLPDGLLDGSPPPGWGARWRDGLHLLRTLAGLIANYFLLPRRIDHFYRRLDTTLGTHRPDLAPLRPDELARYYRDLEGRLLTRWDAPLINDFFAMIFFGLLRKLTEKWGNDPNGTLQNNLLASNGGMISAEPPARLREMARLVAGDPQLANLLSEGSLPQILARLQQMPDLSAQYQAYLDKFGDRCLEELKLESPTLHDDPLILLRSVGQLARQFNLASCPLQKDGEASTVRQLAEQQLGQALAGHPLRRMIFGWVLKNARNRVRDRENLRFERTRVFGRVRLIFMEIGRKFQALGLLAEPRDIFYLEVEEVLGFIEGTTTTTDLPGLVALRRAELDRHQRSAPPAGRFETRGMVHHGNVFTASATIEAASGDWRQGLGCCPGLVRGRVRVVANPQTARLQPGDILVAERTDPGWIILFTAAAGLLVEHGSLLSHAAIVARELGLPAIVSLKGVTHWLKDGDWVEFDGSRGVVRKLKAG